MFPTLEICRKRICAFDSANPNSTFDEFWDYKLRVETTDSILDDLHLDTTTRQLDEKLLRHGKWGLWWTGIPSEEEVTKILKTTRSEYEMVRHIVLGDGRIATDKQIQNAVSGIYAKLCGITHNRWGDSPDSEGYSYIVGKAKVLMFIWGQTPGFDRLVRGRCPLSDLSEFVTKYTPAEFCGFLANLDQWVAAWNQQYKQQGVTFQHLSPNRPIGRIIDIIYWVEPDDCHLKT